VSVLVARSLGPDTTGTYNFLTFVILIAAVLSTLGAPTAVTRYVAGADHDTKPQVARSLLVWVARGTIAGAVVYAAIVGVVLTLTHAASSTATILVAIGIPVSSLPAVLVAALTGLQRFDRLLIVSVATSVIQFAATLIVVVLHGGVVAFLVALSVSAAVQCCLLLLALGFRRPLGDPVSVDVRRAFLRDVLPLSGIVVTDSIIFQRSEVLVLALVSSNRQIAFYAVPYALVSRSINLFPGAVLGVLLPRFSASSATEKVQALYSVSSRYITLIAAPLVALGVATADALTRTVYGAAFAPMTPVLIVLLLSGGVVSVMGAAAPVVYGTGRPTAILKITLGAAVIDIGLMFALIPSLGALGAALASGAAQAVGVSIGVWWVRTRMQLRFPAMSCLRIVLAGAISATIARLVAQVLIVPDLAQVIVTLVVFAPLYITGLIAFGGVTRTEQRSVVRRIRRALEPRAV
jgi:O-antigen/teichoic acid export membrane protein